MKILLACLLLFEVCFCFHYTCDQLKDEIIPDRIQLPTKYACVVFEYPMSQIRMPYYDSVFVKDTVTSKQYSLATVYGSCNYCVEGNGWEVVSNGTYPVLCNTEIVLLFTSTPTRIWPMNIPDDTHSNCVCIVHQFHSPGTWSIMVHYGPCSWRMELPSANYELLTLVSPNAISSYISSTKSSSFYMGIGIDESEEMFLMQEWKSSETDKNVTFASFDWVITANQSGIVQWGQRDAYLYPITFYYTTNTLSSNSILGNAAWKGKLKIVTDADMNPSHQLSDPVIRVTGYVQYNSTNFISLISDGATIDIVDSGSVDITMYGDFQIVYNTHTASYVNQRVNESFLLYFDLVNESPITEFPTTELFTTTDQPNEPVESYCACDVDEDGIAKNWASEIWMDIVILIDTSRAMGTDGVDEVSEVVESFIGMMNLDSNGQSELYSRVGLISLSSTVEVIYNLNMTSDSEVNLQKSSALYVDIAAGFQTALKMFQEGRRMPNYRQSAKEIIYFITNSEPQGILNGAYEFKTSGGIIIVANYVREGQVPLDGLRSIASPHYFFTNLTSDYTYNLQVLCDANCFCPPELHAFTDSSVNPRQEANRGCYHVANSGIPYKNAIKTCEKEESSITSIHDDQKQFFVSAIVSDFGPKTKYWMGYQNDGKNWKWIDNSTNPYNNWDVSNGQPNTNGGQHMCAYAVQTTGFITEWYAANCNGGYYFVCEKPPCAAGRYCTFDE